MSTPFIQTSFHVGELAPSLTARVDIAKYHAALALARNFYVDYRGGVSTRMGTKYILQAYKSSTDVRLIGFSASFDVTYVLEFGDFYIRFINDGSYVLEATKTITAITKANPAVVTSAGHGYVTDDWVFLSVAGMTEVNGKYFHVTRIDTNNFSLQDLNGVNINSTSYGTFTSGTAARVYTLATPYAAADLALLKFAQNVTAMILTHTSYAPYVLTFISSASWTLSQIIFGSSISPPTGLAVASSNTGAESIVYSYVATAVDINDQESGPSSAAETTNANGDIRVIGTTGTTLTVTWTGVTGAVFYNIYRGQHRYGTTYPAGQSYGFVGYVSSIATTFIDTITSPDFAITPPIAKNPFQGAGVLSINITAAGVYTTVPSITIGAPPSGGSQATGNVSLTTTSATLNDGGHGYSVNDTAVHAASGLVIKVTGVSFGVVTTFTVLTQGTWTTGATPANPVTLTSSVGAGFRVNLTWGVGAGYVINAGAGYTSAPAVTFSAGAATATTTLQAGSGGNPGVCAFFQQRLVLASQPLAPQTFYMSIPGSYYNFNVSNPVQADDAITGSIVSGQLNTIKSMIPMPSGLIVLTSRQAWQINGGSAGAAVTPIDAQAQAQAYNGASDVPPILSNYDILYVQAKGSIVRDLSYNFYTNIYTGADISVLSSHLFYGYTITEWAYAEEPFKTIWAVRSDGDLLCLTFVKEQEIIGWTKSDTNGEFKSVATVTETVAQGAIDAVYFVVERVINGNTVKYIERMAERYFPNGVEDAWCVDAGLQYDSTPATSFSGAEHLAGAAVVGLADGVAFSTTISPTGTFTLATAASKVTVGLAYTPRFQTLRADLGEPTVQGKSKKISSIIARIMEGLGLSSGTSLSRLVPMKDLVVGNVGSQTNELVTDLVTGDAMVILDPYWNQDGQFYIEQPYPMPATILGVIPDIVVGDTK